MDSWKVTDWNVLQKERNKEKFLNICPHRWIWRSLPMSYLHRWLTKNSKEGYKNVIKPLMCGLKDEIEWWEYQKKLDQTICKMENRIVGMYEENFEKWSFILKLHVLQNLENNIRFFCSEECIDSGHLEYSNFVVKYYQNIS